MSKTQDWAHAGELKPKTGSFAGQVPRELFQKEKGKKEQRDSQTRLTEHLHSAEATTSRYNITILPWIPGSLPE